MKDRNWVQDELRLPDNAPLKQGGEGIGPRRVQEHLTLQGFGTAIDGIYGPATRDTVADYQVSKGLHVDGIVGEDTWGHLVAPIRRALSEDSSPRPYPRRVETLANQHLMQNPREIGGPNRGPWVRLYMQGEEGRPYAWCNGFVSFILHQAAEAESPPLSYEWGVDQMVGEGMERGCFVRNPDSLREEGAPAVFVVKCAPDDYCHTGFVTRWGSDSVKTIEGNTNVEGTREGVKVMKRRRPYDQLHFLTIE